MSDSATVRERAGCCATVQVSYCTSQRALLPWAVGRLLSITRHFPLIRSSSALEGDGCTRMMKSLTAVVTCGIRYSAGDVSKRL